MTDAAHEIPVSLFRGGAFYSVQEKVRLIRPHRWDLQRRLPFAVAIVWLPLVVLTVTNGGIRDLTALLVDYRVYARVFIAIPLLLIGQITMETRFRVMAQQFLDSNIIRIEDLSRFRQIMQRTRRLRDARLPELIAIIAVYAQVGYLVGSGRLSFAAWAVDAGSNSITPAGYYSMLVTHAVFLFLMAIVFWKWAIWVYVLRRISLLNLQLDATNGDLTAGLGFLGELPRAFVPVVSAVSAVMGANWRAQVLTGQLTVDDLRWPAAILAVITLMIFFLPLALFMPALLHEKKVSTHLYGSLQHLVSLHFRRKWMNPRNEHIEDLLGGPDVSSLADLSSAFKNVEQMFTYPVRKNAVIAFLGAFALPFIPVVTTQIPLREMLKQLFAAIH